MLPNLFWEEEMPVYKCANGKYRIGEGPCRYTSKSDADAAYKKYEADLKKKPMSMESGVESIRKRGAQLKSIL